MYYFNRKDKGYEINSNAAHPKKCNKFLCCINMWNEFLGVYLYEHRLRWSRGSVLPFSTQVRGFKPGGGRRIFKGEKILSTPSFGGEVKLSVSCRRFAACKRSLNGVEVIISAKLPDISCLQFHLSLLGSLGLLWTWRHLVTKVGTSKGGGK